MADEVLRALAGFSVQWEKYQESVDTLGRRLESAQKAFEDMQGTRTRAMNKQLARVDELRTQRHLTLPDVDIEEAVATDNEDGEVPL